MRTSISENRNSATARKESGAQLSFRPDIVWESQAGGQTWIAQDPVRGTFFSFNEVEYAVAKLIEKSNSANEILVHLRKRFPNLAFSATWLLTVLQRFQQFHLLQPVTTTQLHGLVNAGNKSQSRKVIAQLLSPLAVRVPLGNPTTLLNGLKPLAKLLFHRWTVLLICVFGSIVGFAVLQSLLTNHFSVSSQLQQLTGDRIAIALLCYLACKCLHELGHALACVYHGARCKGVGIMLLCFTPCLYCDTTDSWRLKSRWRRAGIAAAGIYIELIIASFAGLLWLLTEAGTLHYLAASTMVVCSISTLLVNLNPLLKYDGYYILADAWNISNLSEQSRSAAARFFSHLLASSSSSADESSIRTSLDGSAILLSAYWLTAVCYRTFILLVILCLIWYTLVPIGLGMIAMVLTASLGIGLLIAFAGWLKNISVQTQKRNWRVIRILLALGVLSLVTWSVTTYPLQVRVTALGVSDLLHKHAVFSPRNARLIKCIESGKRVEDGDLLVKLVSHDLELEIEALRGEAGVLRVQIDALESQQSSDETAAYRLPALSEQLKSKESSLELLNKQLANLNVVVNGESRGIWLASRLKAERTLTSFQDDRIQLAKFSPKQLGCQVKEGELLGWIINSPHCEISAMVHEDAVRRLDLGMQAKVRWDAAAGVEYTAQIEHISRETITTTPTEILGDPRFISVRNDKGELVPEAPHYEVRLVINMASQDANHSVEPYVLPGAIASVRFETHKSTLLELVLEYVQQNLRPIY